MAPTDDINGQPESRSADMEDTVNAPDAETTSQSANAVGGGDSPCIE